MIQYVSGDLLHSRAQVIAHGVAPNDPHGEGLALALREWSPAMYKDFRHYCQTQHPDSGTLWAWAGTDGRRIVALFTQEAAGRGGHPGAATTSHVAHALKALAKLARAERWQSLALPRLATGVGRLSWAEVKPLIEQHLGDLGVPVYVYETFHAGQVAPEAAKAA
jgi:O-acetyl-ADP-ribose deacetylase (regulator of RNase III)